MGRFIVSGGLGGLVVVLLFACGGKAVDEQAPGESEQTSFEDLPDPEKCEILCDEWSECEASTVDDSCELDCVEGFEASEPLGCGQEFENVIVCLHNIDICDDFETQCALQYLSLTECFNE